MVEEASEFVHMLDNDYLWALKFLKVRSKVLNMP